MSQARARLAPACSIFVRVVDLEHEFDTIRRLLADEQAWEPLVIVGATRRSMPLAVIAAHAGLVVGVLARGATSREFAIVKARGTPDRLHAFRDIARIMTEESTRARDSAGNTASSI